MKTKIYLSVLALGFIVSAFSQNATMELTFTAEYYDQYVPLDSVLIENLTQGGDTTLYAPDTTLVLDYVTNIGSKKATERSTFSISQNYPNPFNEKTEFNLYLTEKETIKIHVRDILGRELVHYENHLNQGSHSFAFYSGNKKYYFLTISGKKAIKTIKMLNTNSSTSYGGKCKLVYNKYEDKVIGIKSQRLRRVASALTEKSVNDFGYNPGDELMFTAYSLTAIGNLGSSVIVDIPEMSANYEFDIIGGLRCHGEPAITDVDGNTYNTVQIGSQCWMKENLKTTKYRNGTPIPNVTDGTTWAGLTTGAYVWFENDISWKDLYGALYNWPTTNDTNGLCPTGWHVPTHSEWSLLTNFIGGIDFPHGNELKSCRQINSPLGGVCNASEHPRWNEDNTQYGTDDYGFSGIPGNSRHFNGSFNQFPSGDSGVWWSSTSYQSVYGLSRVLWYNFGYIDIYYSNKEYGFSVRCLKD